MKIQRYELTDISCSTDEYAYEGMEERQDGEWVKWEDASKLVKIASHPLWRPINTAPKNVRILVFGGNADCGFGVIDDFGKLWLERLENWQMQNDPPVTADWWIPIDDLPNDLKAETGTSKETHWLFDFRERFVCVRSFAYGLSIALAGSVLIMFILSDITAPKFISAVLLIGAYLTWAKLAHSSLPLKVDKKQ